ncbi:MAG: riboflavin biosynthesis protein RibD [Alphaproteobacteria bacterium]|nr:MAG: riboflavin biosynthesis protein RibD [Alphaproteobacteria bacterium]
MASDVDIHNMKSALSLACRGLGRVWPNPSVGCVIVQEDCVIARARTADGGRPHAETQALEQAGALAKGATLYVTLEPCTHHGQTAPCVEAIIAAGIAHVVIGTLDVDPRVSGKSVALLKAAGIKVTQGVLEDECCALNIGFIKRITENRPFVTLKMACTLDGKIACASGESQWITGSLARRHTHQVRSRHDAILVGCGTAVVDDPALSTRLDGVAHTPVRVVLDSKLRISPDSQLVRTATDVPLWVFGNGDDEQTSALRQHGVVIHSCDPHNLVLVLGVLADQGITRVLVEGGAEVHASFLRQGLCDELFIYRAPTLLGGDGKSMIRTLNIETLVQRYDFVRCSSRILGADVLEIYKQKDEG